MNFYKTLGLKNSRIDVADALRGLAVAGIILYHSVEHLFPYQNHGIEDYFEHCFLSQRMHLAKPDAHIYEEVIRQANIHPDETLFIDDLKENCEAAEKLGIHTFQNVKLDDWLALRF